MLGRIFDPFLTTKEPRKGTGHISYGIVVNDHREDFTVHQTDDGKTFRVWIPRAVGS